MAERRAVTDDRCSRPEFLRRLRRRALGPGLLARTLVWCLVSGWPLMLACGDARTADSAESGAGDTTVLEQPVRIAVTSDVLHWLVLELLEGGVVVEVLGGSSGEVPTPENVLSAASADLILLQGAGFEPWLDQVSLPPSRTVDTTADLDLIPLESDRHSHVGGEEEHSHGRFDAASWHDPARWRQQASRVTQALGGLARVDSQRLDQRWLALQERFEALDAGFRDLRAALDAGPTPVLVAEGGFRYLADALGVRYEAVDDLGALDAHEVGHLRRDRSERIIVLDTNAERSLDQELSVVERVQLDDLVVTRDESPPDLLGRSEANLQHLAEIFQLSANQ